MTGFTPGPWRIGPWKEVLVPSGKKLLVDGVAIPAGNHSKIGEAEANARLIAAAPELLAACKAAEKVLDKPIVTGYEHDVIKALRHAIIKATDTDKALSDMIPW